jgi:hypothetical protein
MSFCPCPRCKRHVRAGESACPFCNAALPADFGPAPRVVAPVTGPFARAAILFMGAATTACSSGSAEPVPSPYYGPAVIDADATTKQDSGEPLPVVFYGPAIVDASADDSTEPAPVPFYGPAVFDAGREQDAGTGVDASDGGDSEEPAPVPFYGPAVVDSGSEQ